MKKLTKTMAVLTLLVILVISVVSCTNNDGVKSLDGSVTIVLDDTINDSVADKVYLIDLKAANMQTNDTLLSLIDYMNTLYTIDESYNYTYEDNYISYSITNGFVNSLGVLVPNPTAVNYQYISLFTSVEADKDVSEYAESPFEYNGTTLYYSGWGIGQMSLQSNAIYYFKLIEYVA